MKRLGIILLISITLICLFISLYWWLGGFNPVETEKVNLGTLQLAGIHFKGTPQDPALRKTFESIESLIKENPEANLHTIYFEEPAGKTDTMEVFVGVERKLLKEMDDLEILNLNAENAVVAGLRSHRFVMPGPKKVQKRIKEFAEEEGLPEPNLFVDVILSKVEVKVIGLLK